jgi:hypothetical protein
MIGSPYEQVHIWHRQFQIIDNRDGGIRRVIVHNKYFTFNPGAFEDGIHFRYNIPDIRLFPESGNDYRQIVHFSSG